MTDVQAEPERKEEKRNQGQVLSITPSTE